MQSRLEKWYILNKLTYIILLHTETFVKSNASFFAIFVGSLLSWLEKLFRLDFRRDIYTYLVLYVPLFKNVRVKWWFIFCGHNYCILLIQFWAVCDKRAFFRAFKARWVRFSSNFLDRHVKFTKNIWWNTLTHTKLNW